jgi:uncharacterized membrane protein (DUF106 family)
MNGDSARVLPRVRFNPEVNLGHVLQIITLTGAVVTGYISMQRDMTSMRAEYQVAMAGFESRLTVAEHAIVERRTEEREFMTEMRAKLDELQKSFTAWQLQDMGHQKAMR